MGSVDILRFLVDYIPTKINIPCYQVQEKLVERQEYPYCIVQQISAVAQGQADMQEGYSVGRTVLFRFQVDCYSMRIGVINATSYMEQLSLVLNARSTYFELSKEGIYLLPSKDIGSVSFTREEDSNTALRSMLDIQLYSIITAELPNLGYVEQVEGVIVPL